MLAFDVQTTNSGIITSDTPRGKVDLHRSAADIRPVGSVVFARPGHFQH